MSKVNDDGVKGVQLSLSWRPVNAGEIPEGAVAADDGCYVARGRHEGKWIPGKFCVGHGSAYVPYDHQEVAVDSFEILVQTGLDEFGDSYEWRSCSGADLPKRTLVAGADDGHALFVARAKVNDEMCVGKAYAPHACAYFPHGGEEHSLTEFEVLTFK